MGDRCVPVPSHLCAVAYDDDGCKVTMTMMTMMQGLT